ncbi:DUF5685 family protein [Parafrankia discariae]|uniref:DUF5685 family protein n=1 Tax=Parafrankia discariae TaxID=365528 RepID=UPI0003A12701|nr:DUF5685 family protein [Parafrankia discariae]
MFGLIQPCRGRLGATAHELWSAHLCGLCLALRDTAGQPARLATTGDGVVLSLLVAAQRPTATVRRGAGPCPLRSMRTARVVAADDPGITLAASASLAAAAARIHDHARDGDGLAGTRLLRAGATRAAGAVDRAADRTGRRVGFDTAELVESVHRQFALETATRRCPEADGAADGNTERAGALLALIAPTEDAAAAAFRHCAELAGRPENTGTLAEAGRLFGRLTHLLDAVTDRAADGQAGRWNPLTASGTTDAAARSLCLDALTGLRLAVDELTLAPSADAALLRALLVDELAHTVTRTFAGAGGAGGATTARATGTGTAPVEGGGWWRRRRARRQARRRGRRQESWCERCGDCCEACEVCDCGCDC